MVPERTIIMALEIMGEFMRQRRINLGVSHEQLSMMTGIDLEDLEDFEDGGMALDLADFLQLCAALDLYPFIGEKESDDDLVRAMKGRWGNASRS